MKIVDLELNVIQLGCLGITTRRNTYGRQDASFEGDILVTDRLFAGEQACLERTAFIRAPGIVDIHDPEIEVIARLGNEIVGVKKGKKMATSFHPEITPSLRWHRAFLESCWSEVPKSPTVKQPTEQ